MASDHKFMEYFYRIFLPNILQNVSFKKLLKVADILHLLLGNSCMMCMLQKFLNSTYLWTFLIFLQTE